jgi:Rod binding domain-containing protein
MMDQAADRTMLLPGAAPAGLGVPAGPAKAGDARMDAVRQTAEEFEAMFLAQMLAPIFDSLGSDGLFGGGGGERMFQPLLVQEYGKAIAANGGVGIADAVQREILKLQEIES